MNPSVINACNALESLAAVILANFSSDVKLCDHFGWNHPALNRKDLAEIPLTISRELKEFAADELAGEFKSMVEGIPSIVASIQNQNLPYFFNGNGTHAIPAFISSMYYLRMRLTSARDSPIQYQGWTFINDSKAMPTHLARRVKSVQMQLDELGVNREEIISKLERIEEAHQAAESLPIELKELDDAKKKILRTQEESSNYHQKISEFFTKSKEEVETITKKQLEAKALVEKCEDAYQITTTKGLAAAFDERASKLNLSIAFWVGGLLIALISAIVIGYYRLSLLSESLKDVTPHWGLILIQLTLSFLSVGAPLWLAWLATRQIGQRFRLAEDYAYKASVAKAYEGYRKEAFRIDKNLELRLFSSALSRLEEPPLRLIETDSHGSPWHELFKSENFKNAPKDLQDRVKELLSTGIVKPKKAQSASEG